VFANALATAIATQEGPMQHRNWSRTLLHIVIAGVLPFTFAGTLGVQAEICTPEKFYDGSLLHYAICNVPDIDQLRTDGAFTAGLPNGGKMYCAPTAAMNWMAYIANHGYPAIMPGPGYWGPESGPVQPQYQKMNNFLLQMGALMDTDPEEGTTSDDANIAVQLWLNSVLSSGDFVVSTYQASGVYAPLFIHLAKAAVDGALVNAQIGWYKTAADASPEVQDFLVQLYGKLPNGFFRDGGHVVTMVSARNDFQFPQIGLHDPASPNNGATSSQSSFNRDVYHVVDEAHKFNGSFRAQSRVEDIGTNAFLDGYFRIKPKYGLTADRNTFYLVRPISWIENGIAGQPVLTSFASGSERTVTDLAIHPERTTHPYLVEDDNTIWQLDVLTGQSSRFATVGNPRRLTFGGPDQNLYVLLPNHIIALDTDGREKARVLVKEPLRDVAYDSARNRVVGVAERGDRVFLFDESLAPLDIVQFAAPFCDGEASAATDTRTGTIWLLCKGSPTLTRLVVGDQRFGEKGVDARQISLEGAQNPSAIALDDNGRLFISEGGTLTEFAISGRPVEGSRFSGLPAGQNVDVLRSFSNFDPRTMTDVRFRNVLPADAQR
jgi:hypothetical protein